LTERFNGKEVYLIGTMNQSTMLAQRTKKLIEELKPDTVLVQANERYVHDNFTSIPFSIGIYECLSLTYL
jgi:pheromone shutdown protein TraB